MVAMLAISALSWSSALGQQWTTPQRGWLYVLDVGGTDGGKVLLVDPSEGIIKGVLPTGYHPNFGMCPDGSHIYILDGSQSSGHLSIFETGTGKLLERVPVPNRVVYTVRPSGAGVGCSNDSRWLFVQTMITLAPGVDRHSIVVIDTSTGRVSPRSKPIPDCGVAQFIPWPFETWDMAVACSFTNSIRLLSLGSQGEVRQTRDLALRWANSVEGDAIRAAKPQRITTSAVVDVENHSVAILRASGGLDLLDPDTLLLRPKVREKWQRWIPGSGVTSPHSGVFYVGFAPYEQRTQPGGLLNWIEVMRMADWSEITSIRTTLPFWSIAISSDGKMLYAVNTDAQSITEMDTSVLKELKTIPRMGEEPSLVLVQP
jgi:DNA-binding beta-propeller fold protein YncE